MTDAVPPPQLVHEYLFKFLQLSPSYFAVHRFKKGELAKKGIEKIPGYKDILTTYDLCGDVFEPVFDEWWYYNGYKLFGQKISNQFVFKCDLTKSLDQNISLLRSKYLEKEKQKRPTISSFQFLKSKIQEKVLTERYKLIVAITPFYDPKQKYGFKYPLWFLVFREIYSGPYFSGLRRRAKAFIDIKSAIEYEEGTLSYPQKKYCNKQKKYIEEYVTRPTLHIVGYKEKGLKRSAQKAKRYISMLVSKERKEALYIAEHAARGIFPCKEICNTSFDDFDYLEIEKTINLTKFIIKLQKFRDKTGNFLHKKQGAQFNPSKMKSNVDRYIDHEINYRLLEEIDKDLKPLIQDRSDALARKKYQQLKQIGKKSAKPTPQRSGSSKG